MASGQQLVQRSTSLGATQPRSWALETIAVHAGEPDRPPGAPAVTPIYQSSTYLYDGVEGQTGYADVKYARCNNTPNHIVLANKMAALECTEAAVVTSSGMAAISTTLLTLLRSGDHVITQKSLYGGTDYLLTSDMADLNIEHTRVDSAQPKTWSAALRPTTKVLYLETISNPLIEVPDLQAAVAFAKRHNLITVIDNTFASPVVFRPAEWGFDVIVHSATKYLNGHSDLICGVVCSTAERITKITDKLNHLGGCLDPHACFLLQRGLKTLPLRVRQQNASALALAQFLQAQPQVARVYYPGLPSDPAHERVQQLFGGACGGVVAFELVAGAAGADKLMQALKLPLCAVSLGGVETLITRPALTTHVGQTVEQLEARGIKSELLRVALGVEATADLVEDFTLALASLGGKMGHDLADGAPSGPEANGVPVKNSILSQGGKDLVAALSKEALDRSSGEGHRPEARSP